MDASDQMNEPINQNDGLAAEACTQKGTSPADMLRSHPRLKLLTILLKATFEPLSKVLISYNNYRIKQQMSNHCFEMSVQLNAGR